MTTTLVEKEPKRERWAVYVRPDTIADVKRLADHDRKTIGQYLEDLIASKMGSFLSVNK